MGFADANAYLASRGGAASKFENIGDEHTGRIVDVDVQPATQPNGDVKKDKNGNVVNQLVITWITSERDPQNATDRGERKLYTSWRLENAIKAAIRDTGADGFEPDGILTVKYVATEESKVKGFAPAKVFEASYKRPNLGGISVVDESTGEVDKPVDPDKLALAKTLKSAGQDIDQVASITGLSTTVLANEVFGF